MIVWFKFKLSFSFSFFYLSLCTSKYPFLKVSVTFLRIALNLMDVVLCVANPRSTILLGQH